MANAKIRITAEDRTKAALSSARKNLDGFTQGLTGMHGKLTALLGAAGIGSLIRSNIELGESLSRSSKAFNIQVETLSAYQYAARQAKISNQELDTGLSTLTSKLAEAARNGAGETAAYFRSLGISVTDTNGQLRNTGVVLKEIARKFATSRDGSEKLAVANKLLGEGVGRNFIPMLNTLSETTAEARRLGQVVSTDFAEAAARFTRETDRMKASLGSFLATTDRGGGILDSLLNVLKGLQAAGIVVSETFVFLGKDIAAVAGVLTESARGDFKGAVRLWRDHSQELEKLAEQGRKAREALFSDAPAPDQKKKITDKPGLTLPDDQKLDGLNARLRGRLETLKLSFMTEQEQERAHHEARLRIVEEAWVFEQITIEDRNRIKEEAELRHQAKMGSITAQAELDRRNFAQMSAREKTQTVLGEMLRLTNGVATHNKALFQINKVAAIADASINTWLGASKTMGKYPYPLNVALAGLSLAAGFAQVDAIRSASFGGSTSAPSIGGGSAVPITDVSGARDFPAPPPQQQRQRDTIIIRGADPKEIFTGQQLRDIIENIFESDTTGVSFTS